ncbi:DUF3108 domain-containing protein [Alkanindiges illinoisensis]|uniref:DUF3108 domain-containing protein n=1 Tax=Alkanindiges illinoisensis TaxID=197183 RepID=UPI000AFBC703|nr:DUF3108 domain-containing protein [Alkanindiges illinoisensis]
MTGFKQMLTKISCKTILATALASITLSSAYAVVPFTATYSFNLDNKASGTAVRKLSRQGNQWVYNFDARVPVIATASEKSVFSLSNNQVVSQHYQRQYKILVHNQQTSLDFNNASKSIQVKRDQKNSQLPWQAGVLDDLNVEIQLREDLKKGGLKSTYLIADQKDITPRQFVNEGSVKVNTPSGSYDAVKVRINHQKKDKSTVFWLAPSLDYLPVKVTHNDDGSVYTLNLTNYKPS